MRLASRSTWMGSIGAFGMSSTPAPRRRGADCRPSKPDLGVAHPMALQARQEMALDIGVAEAASG